MAIKDTWLPCEASAGMFDSEYSVTVSLPNGDTVSFFADKNLIRMIQGKSYVKVILVETKERENDRNTVLLPTESFEQGSRWLKVPSRELIDNYDSE